MNSEIARPLEITTAYYIDEFSDEYMPCDCTLDGWAEWLASLPNEECYVEKPVSDGAEFDGYAVEYLELEAHRQAGGSTYVIAPPPEGFICHALKWGKGAGWSADMLADQYEGWPTIHELLENYGTDPVEYVAFRRDRERKGVFKLRRRPLSVTWRGAA